MDLLTLAAVVVGGVIGVVALTVALGWSAQLTLTERTARARYLQDYPRSVVASVQVGDRGRAALLVDGEAVGVVSVLGDRAVTRRLAPRDVVVREDDDGLTLRLPDLGAPRLAIALGDDAARAIWRQRLTGAS